MDKTPISYFIQYRRIKVVGDLVKRLVHCDARITSFINVDGIARVFEDCFAGYQGA